MARPNRPPSAAADASSSYHEEPRQIVAELPAQWYEYNGDPTFTFCLANGSKKGKAVLVGLNEAQQISADSYHNARGATVRGRSTRRYRSAGATDRRLSTSSATRSTTRTSMSASCARCAAASPSTIGGRRSEEKCKPSFSAPTIDDEKSAMLAGQIYHEARHAEQWHLMARLLAGKGKTAGQIVTDTQIKADIAADAVKKPISTGGAEAKPADAFYQSVYGTGKPHREATLKKLFETGDANTKAQQAYDAKTKDPKATPETKAAALKKWQDTYQAFMAAHAVYKALPEEADAFKTEGAVESKYKAKP